MCRTRQWIRWLTSASPSSSSDAMQTPIGPSWRRVLRRIARSENSAHFHQLYVRVLWPRHVFCNILTERSSCEGSESTSWFPCRNLARYICSWRAAFCRRHVRSANALTLRPPHGKQRAQSVTTLAVHASIHVFFWRGQNDTCPCRTLAQSAVARLVRRGLHGRRDLCRHRWSGTDGVRKGRTGTSPPSRPPVRKER